MERCGGISRGVALAALTLTLTLPSRPLLAAAQAEGVPDAMQRLAALEGSWRADRVEFLDEAGDVVRVSSASAENRLDMDGHVMVHRGRLDEPAIGTRGWYYWNEEDQRLHLGSVASGGRYDEFVGAWDGGSLVMEMLPSPSFPDRSFRMIASEITGDSFLERLEVSTDGGRTWRASSRQRMRRTDGSGDGAGILTAMGAYIGHWRSEDKVDGQDNVFHFELDMGWMDEGRTIARLHITQVAADGSTRTVFEGYKGREPDGSGVYYHAASPSGRASRGEVVVEGPNLVTAYEGWTADGNRVWIRDVFEPLRDGSFDSRTFLRPSPDGDWREIGSDEWTREGPSRHAPPGGA